MEASYGSNDTDYNDGNVKYVASKRAFVLASKVEDDLFLIVMVFLDGRVLLSSTSNPKVFTFLQSSMAQLLNPININKAFSYYDEITEMFTAIVSKFYTKIDALKFVAPDKAILNKLERFLKMPDVKQYLTKKRFEYVEHEQNKKIVLIAYQKQ